MTFDFSHVIKQFLGSINPVIAILFIYLLMLSNIFHDHVSAEMITIIANR